MMSGRAHGEARSVSIALHAASLDCLPSGRSGRVQRAPAEDVGRGRGDHGPTAKVSRGRQASQARESVAPAPKRKVKEPHQNSA
eukprot:4412752-Alexandrium_andersonii.AAC.1